MSGNLDHRPSKIVKKYLLDQNLGSEVTADDEWPIFVDNYPDGSDVEDNLICVYNTAGILQDRIQISGEHVELFGIQIRIRSTTEPIGYSKGKAIIENIDKTIKRTSVAISSSNYRINNANRTTDVLRLGPEKETNRRSFTINYSFSITQI